MKPYLITILSSFFLIQIAAADPNIGASVSFHCVEKGVSWEGLQTVEKIIPERTVLVPIYVFGILVLKKFHYPAVVEYSLKGSGYNKSGYYENEMKRKMSLSEYNRVQAFASNFSEGCVDPKSGKGRPSVIDSFDGQRQTCYRRENLSGLKDTLSWYAKVPFGRIRWSSSDGDGEVCNVTSVHF